MGQAKQVQCVCGGVIGWRVYLIQALKVKTGFAVPSKCKDCSKLVNLALTTLEYNNLLTTHLMGEECVYTF